MTADIRIRHAYAVVIVVLFFDIRLSHDASAEWLHVPTKLEQQVGSANVEALHIDQFGQYWVGLQTGLLLFNDALPGIQPEEANRAPWSAYIVDIETNSNGDLFVLTATQGLFFKPASEPDFSYLSLGEEIGDVRGIQLLIDGLDNVWVRYSQSLLTFNAQRIQRNSVVRQKELLSVAINSNLVLRNRLQVCFIVKSRLTCSSSALVRQQLGSLPDSPKLPVLDATHSGIAVQHETGKVVFQSSLGSFGLVDPDNPYDLEYIETPGLGGKKIRAIAETDDGFVAISDNHVFIFGKNLSLSQSIEVPELQEPRGITLWKNSAWITSYTGVRLFGDTDIDIWPDNKVGEGVYVASLAENLTGDLYIGDFYGKLFRKSLSDQEPLLLESATHSLDLADKHVMTLSFFQNQLLVGTFSNGLIIAQELFNGTLTAHNTVCELEGISALASIGDWLLVGTADGKLRASNGAPKECPAQVSSFPQSKLVTSISVDDRYSTAVVTTQENVFVICIDQEPYVCDQLGNVSARPPLFLSSSIGSEGDLWLGTLNDGLIYVPDFKSRRDHDLRKIAITSLEGSAIYAIENSVDNSVWVSSDSGLWLLSSSGKVLDHFSIADGITADDFNHGASLTASDGRVYFGTPFNYVSFSPKEVSKNRELDSIFLRSAFVRDRRGGVTQASHTLDSVELEAWTSSIRIVVSLGDVREKPTYRYLFRLAGFEDNWINTGEVNEITYSSLPPGEYQLFAKGIDASGKETSNTVALAVIVRPPWYSTYSIRSVVVVVVALLLYMIRKVLIRLDQSRKERSRERELLEQTTAQLDRAHELLEDKEKSLGHLIEDSSQYLDLARRITEFSASREGNSVRQESPDIWALQRLSALKLLDRFTSVGIGGISANLYSYTEELSLHIEERLEAKTANVILLNNLADHLTLRRDATYIALVLYELMRNVYQHAFRGRPPDSNIASVYVEKLDSDGNAGLSYKVTVEDNGIGMDDDSVTTASDGGLGLVAELASQFDGAVEASSAAGTTMVVTLRFPERD